MQAARVEMGVSQEALAAATKTSPWAVERAEGGKRPPTITELVAWARHLGRPIHTLFRVVEET
jgi:transcriptional regulator with XRE-family HTH domain